MLRVGIYDASHESLCRHKQVVQRIFNRLAVNADVQCFQNREALLGETEQSGKLDIVLINIETDELYGIKTARMVRENSCNTILIFMSACEQHYKEMMSVQPFAFIEKPVEESKMEIVLASAIRVMTNTEESICFTYKKVVYKVFLKKVRYFESRKREMHVFVAGREYLFYCKLDEIENQLNKKNVKFIRVNKSFLVNPIYVREYHYEKVVLDDGTEIGISMKYRTDVRNFFMNCVK